MTIPARPTDAPSATATATPRQAPLRVVRIITRMNVGGPAIHVALLTHKLAALGYDTRLITGSIEPYEGDMGYIAAQYGVTPEVLPLLGREVRPLRDLRVLWALVRLMRATRPHIVHTHTSKAGFVGRIAAKLAGVPVIVHTFHGSVFDGYFSPLTARLYVLMERVASAAADVLIALTSSLRRELAETYHVARKSKIVVLPLGLNLEAFARAPRKPGTWRAQWGIPQDVPLVGCVARLTAVKNHSLLLRAMARVRQTLPRARLVLVGDGELRAALEAEARALGLADVVTFTGWQQDVAPAYSDLDVKVISSVSEGTPVTLIEALAAGCPVVSTRVGGVPDLLDGGALGALVPSGDEEALAAAIVQAVLHPPATGPARQAMQDRYGIDRLVSDLHALYSGMLARKGVPRDAR